MFENVDVRRMAEACLLVQPYGDLIVDFMLKA